MRHLRVAWTTALEPSRAAARPEPAIAYTAPSAEVGLRRLVWGLIAILSALSVANYNDGIVPASTGNMQQVLVLALWVAVTAATILLRPVLAMAFGTEFYAIVGFYAFAAVSVLWSDLSASTILKAAALSITTVAAYRVATRIELVGFVDAVAGGFVLVAAVSVGLVLVWPAIGIDQTWMHQGQWQGVFQSKQSLGTIGAFLMFFAYHRLLNRGGWIRFALVFGLAAVCVVGSQSRGGAAVALAACLCLSLPRRWDGAMRILAFGPVAMTALALVAMTYIVVTGNPYLPLFGVDVDVTERGIIWQYALSHFGDHPLLGFGLNGFWSIDALLHGFEREHGWVLDNYHDGYLGILVETGMAGMALFVAGMALFGLKMHWLIGRRAMSRADATLIIGFLNLVFFIDLTETFFLRSTNINSIILLTFLFMSCRTSGQGGPSAR